MEETAMSNEMVFFGFLLLNLFLPLVFLKFGKVALYVFIGINTAILLPLIPVTASVFGCAVSVSTLMWAPNFLCTDILTEKYGKKAAYGAIYAHVVAPYLVILLVSATLMFTPTSGSAEIYRQIQQVYQYSIQITIWGTVIYSLNQLLDITLYDYIRRKTGDGHLWFRNNASTLFTTFVNNMMFWGIAMNGLIDNWFEVALAGWFVSATVALFDTPFIYLAKWIQPIDQKEEAHV